MAVAQPHILLLALGNEILGDDALGLLAARQLSTEWNGKVEIKEASTAGFGLLDYLSGYDKVLILDSVAGDAKTAGKVRLISTGDFSSHSVSSPHFIGLPELIETAHVLGIPFPTDIKLLVMSVADPFVLREGLTRKVAGKMPEYVEHARKILASWTRDEDMQRRRGRILDTVDD